MTTYFNINFKSKLFSKSFLLIFGQYFFQFYGDTIDI